MIFDYFNKNIKKYTWKQIACIKFSVLFFTLMVAKLWSGILGLDWYVYMILGIIFMVGPIIILFRK